MTVKKAFTWPKSNEYDLIVLDLMIPKIEGLEVLKRIRSKKNSVPVLVLTAKNTVEDIVKGLDAGCDDYLTKPFAFVEFLARIRALLRREKNGEGASPADSRSDLVSGHPQSHEAREGD